GPGELGNGAGAGGFRRADRPERVVMDGCPRRLAQAKAFDRILQEQNLDLTGVVSLAVEDAEIVRRLSGRWSCPKPGCKATYHVVNNPPKVAGICDRCGTKLVQRDDDKEETVKERLRVYHGNTVELIPYYRARGLLREVTGSGDIEEIYATILRALNCQAGSAC